MEGGGKRGGGDRESEKGRCLTLEKMERSDRESCGGGGWQNYKGKMINIRNVTMKPSGRREGWEEGGEETKGNKKNKQRGDGKREMRGREESSQSRGEKGPGSSGGGIDGLMETTAKRLGLQRGLISN